MPIRSARLCRWFIYFGCSTALLAFCCVVVNAADDASPSDLSAPQALKETQARELKPSETKTEAAWISIPGGIADVDGKVAYVASVTDGVEALDMATGKPIWESKEAKYPVALISQDLIAQAPRGSTKVNTLTLVVLDSATKRVIREIQPIVFPDWVAVDGGIGLSFSSSVALNGNELLLMWQAERQFVGGTPRTPEAVAAAKKFQSGVVHVDLDSGKTSVAIDDLPKALKLPKPKAFYDVGDKRVSSSDSQENLAGGIQIIHRILEARNQHSGKPLWRHEIAGDIMLPANLPATVEKSASRQQPQQQR